MQEVPDNELDDLFRKSLNNTSNIPFDPKAWDAMEKKLDSKKRRGAFYWRISLGILSLLILLGLFIANTTNSALKTLNNKEDSNENIIIVHKNPELTKPNKIGNTKSQDNKKQKGGTEVETATSYFTPLKNKNDATSYQGSNIKPQHARTQLKEKHNNTTTNFENKNRHSSNSEETTNNTNIPSARNDENNNISDATTKNLKSNIKKDNAEPHNSLANDAGYLNNNTLNAVENKNPNNDVEKPKALDNKQETENTSGSNSESIPTIPFGDITIKEIAYTKKETIEDSTKKDTTEPTIVVSNPATQKKDNPAIPVTNKKLWSLNLIMNPEFSSSPSFTMYKPGYNMGLMVEYYLSKRISIMAGGLYSRKVYVADGYEYKPENNWWPRNTAPSTVKATCNVVEVPVFLRYKFVNKQTYNIYITTGLLSYIMLRENYTYIYSPGTNTTDLLTSKEVVNKNRYFFGVYNLSMGIEKHISPNWSVQVEPYAQIPLTGIGEGKIKLISSGVYFTLKYYLPVKAK